MKSLIPPNDTVAPRGSNELLLRSLGKLDKTALGIATGAFVGGALFVVTISLIMKGGEVVGPNIKLLGQYFTGYDLTLKGSLVGLLYGFGSGFLLGWLAALLRNLLIAIFIHTVKLKAVLSSLNDFMSDL